MIGNIQLLWFSLCFLFLFLEMGNPGLLYFVSFSFGALCACIVTLYSISMPFQLAIFLGGTSCALLFVYFFTKEKENQLSSPSHRSNIDALIGKKVMVYQSFQDENVWLAKIYGQVWVVKSISNETFVAGQQVVIRDVQGCHLRVDKMSTTVYK